MSKRRFAVLSDYHDKSMIRLHGVYKNYLKAYGAALIAIDEMMEGEQYEIGMLEETEGETGYVINVTCNSYPRLSLYMYILWTPSESTEGKQE